MHEQEANAFSRRFRSSALYAQGLHMGNSVSKMLARFSAFLVSPYALAFQRARVIGGVFADELVSLLHLALAHTPVQLPGGPLDPLACPADRSENRSHKKRAKT